MRFIGKDRGFTMIEMVLILGCMGLCALLLSSLIALLPRLNAKSYTAEDAIALRQLQLILAQAQHMEIQEDTLIFTYHGETCSLELYADKLVKRDGFEVMMQGLDEISFDKTNGCVSLRYRRNHHTREVMLACE